jgi:hypothetical protein
VNREQVEYYHKYLKLVIGGYLLVRVLMFFIFGLIGGSWLIEIPFTIFTLITTIFGAAKGFAWVSKNFAPNEKYNKSSMSPSAYHPRSLFVDNNVSPEWRKKVLDDNKKRYE